MNAGMQAPLHGDSVQPILINGGVPGPTLEYPDFEDVDTSLIGVMGYRLHSSGKQLRVEIAAVVCAIVGWVCAGWTMGLSTFCAYNKGDGDAASVYERKRVFWEECYQVSRAITGTGDNGRELVPTHLPQLYFDFLFIAVLGSVLGPLLWLTLYKCCRQAVRPIRAKEKVADGLRELPQTAMFGLAFAVGCASGCGAWVFRQMIGLVHNLFFMQARGARHA